MKTAEVESCLEEARLLAKDTGQESSVAVALAGYSTHIGMLGKIEAALDLGTEAAGLIGDDEQDDRHVLVNSNRSYWLFASGRLPQAIEAFKQWVVWTKGDARVGLDTTGYSVLAWAEGTLGQALVLNGQTMEGMRCVHRAIKLSREHDLQENLIWALSTLSFVSCMRGGLAETPAAELQSAALEAVRIAETVDSPQSTVLATTALGIGFYLAGQYVACEEQLTNAITLARKVGTAREFESYSLAILADSCRARGDLDGAIARAREAAAFADNGGSWTYETIARASLIDALLQAGGTSDEIASLIAEARTLAEKSDGRAILPRLREAEARLEGRSDAATLQAGLREAARMYRGMEMPDPAERLERELASFA